MKEELQNLRTMTRIKIWALSLFCLIAASCEKEDDDDKHPTNNTKTFTVSITNQFEAKDFFQSGIFNTPEGASMPGPIGPGAMFGGTAYKFQFQAASNHKLSLATMFVQSNDWVLASGASGIALYDGSGNPIGMGSPMDVTSQIGLYDLGTEVDQIPGAGLDQAPRQAGANTGAPDPNTTVRMVSDASLPAIADVIRVWVEYMGDNTFEATVEATSTASTLMIPGGGSVPVPLSPGGYAVHAGENPFFTVGSEIPDNGMEAIAEDGNPAIFESYAADKTGYLSGFAPGVYAVHSSSVMLFMEGEAAPAGLEELAEDANPIIIDGSLEGVDGVMTHGIFNTPVGAASPGPIGPGASYSFSFEAEPGDYLSFASMMGNTNDLFIAPSEMGIALFENGSAISGNITSQVLLWDAGTEVNEFPGAGSNQAPRQPGPNSGADENATVRRIANVNDGYTYPAVTSVIHLHIEAN